MMSVGESKIQMSINDFPDQAVIYRYIDDDFTFIDVNENVLISENISKDMLIGKKLMDVFPGMKEFGLYDLLLKVHNYGGSEELDARFYKDKRIRGWRHNNIHKLPNGDIIVFYKNLDEHKVLQDMTVQQKEQLSELEKITHMGIWYWDIKTNKITWSDEVFRIFGEEPQSFQPTLELFLSYLSKEEQNKLQNAIDFSIKNNQPYRFDHKVLRKDGKLVYVQESGNTKFNENNEAILMIGNVLDVTQMIKIENALYKKEKQLQEQFKFAQMGEMISMIAHQWKQPLGAISATTMSLQIKLELEAFDLEDKKDRQALLDYFNSSLNDINGFVQNLATTMDDFRNFYKPNKNTTTLRLDNVVTKSLKIIKASLLMDSIEIREEYNSIEEIELYDNELMQVVLNIFKNAQDNFKEKQIENQYIKITTENRTLSICDNGGGIPEDIIEKIFDPYFSTKDEENGTGLGLYLSKIIVEENHNGKIAAKNTDDGVCFIIELGVISEEQKL